MKEIQDRLKLATASKSAQIEAYPAYQVISSLFDVLMTLFGTDSMFSLKGFVAVTRAVKESCPKTSVFSPGFLFFKSFFSAEIQ